MIGGIPRIVLVLLLPGLDGSRAPYAPLETELCTTLGTRATVCSIAYDPRGPHDHASLSAIVASKLPLDGDVVLVGWSFSGPIAVRVAMAHRERVRGIVLAASFLRSPRPALGVLRPFVRATLIGSVPSAWRARLVRTLLLGRAPSPAACAVFGAVLDPGAGDALPPAGIAARVRAVLGIDVRAEFAALDPPVLYLRSSADRLVPRRCAREVLALARDAREVVLDGPHVALATAPREVAAAIASFVGGLTRAPGDRSTARP